MLPYMPDPETRGYWARRYRSMNERLGLCRYCSKKATHGPLCWWHWHSKKVKQQAAREKKRLAAAHAAEVARLKAQIDALIQRELSE